mgnify:FL=1
MSKRGLFRRCVMNESQWAGLSKLHSADAAMGVTTLGFGLHTRSHEALDVALDPHRLT